jgi:hypothetical protein
MKKRIVGALLMSGAALTAFGINTSEAFGLASYRAFAGSPVDQSLLAAGVGLAVLGFVLSGSSLRF